MSGGDIRAAVVGLGFGANHARVLNELPGVELAAVCDRDESRLAAAPAFARYTDYNAMLAAQRLDAVIVAVPARLHGEVARAAIAAGCAVLVEKPLAPSLAEARRLVEAAASAGVPLMPGHIERFNPAVQELRRRVLAGEIGRILQLTARRMGPMVANTRDVNVVYDSGLHDIDVMRWIAGAEVAYVFAEARSDLNLAYEDGITGLIHFAAGSGAGAEATSLLDVNWLAARRIRDLNVRGEKGMFKLDYTAQTLTLYEYGGVLPRGTRGWAPAGEGTDDGGTRIAVTPQEPLAAELGAFIAALRNGASMPVSTDDALAAVAICDALTESARTRQPVRLGGTG